ncbi:MAG: flavoprotein [Ktedonobacteraceae bacterium]
MDVESPTERGLLVIVVCAARSAQDIQELVVLARNAGWDVRVLATPNAAAFIDQPLLQDLTNHAVELYSSPDSYLCSCTPAAVVVVPATFNTLKKWARGEADTFALQLLSRWDVSTIPILAVPRASKELAQEPAFFPSLALLKQRGVHILYEPDAYPPNNAVPWDTILTTLHALHTR